MPTDWNQHGRIAQERDLTRDHAQQLRDLQPRPTEADRREIARFSDTTGLQSQPAPAAQVERVTALIHEATGDRSIQPSPFDELTVDSLERATEMWEQKLGPDRVARVDASLASNTRTDWTGHDESGLTRLSSTDAPRPDIQKASSSVTVTPTAPATSVTPSSTPSHAATPPKPMRGIRR